MKKHLIALVLLLCVCLCWAGAAQGATITCTDASKLQAALNSADAGDVVSFTGEADEDITVTVPAGRTLQVASSASLSAGWLDITVNENAQLVFDAQAGGSIVTIDNNGLLKGNGKVNVVQNGTSGVINSQKLTISERLTNSGLVVDARMDASGGTNELENEASGRIAGGDFSLDSSKLTKNAGTITGGVFIASIENSGTVSGGTFSGEFTNDGDGIITGGNFAKASFPDGVASSPEVYNEKYAGAFVQVKFDLNGGIASERLPEGVIQRGKSLSSYNVDVSKDGYTFNGWSGPMDASEGSALQMYNLSEPITYPGSNLTLTARWQQEGYICIAFCSEKAADFITGTPEDVSYGGSANVTLYVTEGTKLTADQIPQVKQDGQVFLGWWDAAQKEYFDFTQPVKKPDRGTAYSLQAAFARAYTVTFNSMGGTAVDAQTVAENGKATQPADPTRQNQYKTTYSFAGWYTAEGAQFNFDTEITGDITLYARWTANEIPVNLEGEGGKFESQGDWLPSDDGETAIRHFRNVKGFLTINESDLIQPTRDGYKFAGWKQDGIVTFPLKVDGYTNLKAQWKPLPKLTVEVSGIAKDNGCTVLIYDNQACTGEGVTECYGDVGETVYIKLIPVTGYTASGANKTSGSKGKLSEVDNGVATFTFDDGEATVKASFDVNKYPIAFNANGGKVKNAAIFNGSDYQHGQTIGKDDYTPTRDGYTFMGWYVATVEGDTWTMTSTKFELDQDKVQGSMNLMAKWGCTITFNANYASATDADKKLDVVDGGSVNLADEASKSYAFTRNGYNFTGWNTAANGNGTSYDTKDPNTNTITPTGNITLYAQWEIVPAKVTFDPDGGMIGDSTSSVVLSVLTSGDRAGRLSYDDVIDENTVTKSGFVFDGWYYEDFTTKCDDPFDTIFGRDTTLTAKWVEAWTITFNGNGGKDYEGNDTFTQLVRKDADEVTLNQYGGSFTCTNSKFIGWNTEKDGTGAAYSNYETITCTSDMTLYAQWYTGPVDSDPVNTASIMHVLYYSSADATPVRTGSIPYGQAYTLETVDAVKKMSIAFTEPEEKIFSGWRVGNPDEGKIYQPGAKITLNKTSDVTQVYAVWKDKTYAVNVSVSPEGSGTAVATVGGKKVTEAKKGDKVKLTATAEDGWKFSVWSVLDAVGAMQMPTEATYEFTMPSGDVNVTATFVQTYTVTFYPNGGDFAGENAGKTSVAVTDILGDTSLSAVAPTVKQDHSEFDGWAINSGDNITPQKVPLDSKINSSMELEAQWTPDKHTVTFNDPEGGWTVGTALVKKGEVKDITHGDKVSAFKVPTPDVREYHTFKGWYTKNEQGEYDTKFDYAKDVITDDLQLYAKWEPVTYTLEFRTNLPVGITSVEGSVNPCSEQYNAAATGVQVPTGTFTCSFYTQNGWNTQEDGKGESFAAGAVVTYDKFPETSSGATSLMLYAQWTPVPYKLTYNSNGGEGSMGEQTGSFEQSVTVETNKFTKTGYTFTGWNTQADGKGTAYAAKDVIPKLEGDITLYAQWKLAEYTLTLDPDTNGSYVTDLPTGWTANADGSIYKKFTYGDPVDKNLPTPAANEWFEFDSWDKTAPATLTEDTILTAQYTQLCKVEAYADGDGASSCQVKIYTDEAHTKLLPEDYPYVRSGTTVYILLEVGEHCKARGWTGGGENTLITFPQDKTKCEYTVVDGDLGETVFIGANILYKSYDVTFNANGGLFDIDRHYLEYWYLNDKNTELSRQMEYDTYVLSQLPSADVYKDPTRQHYEFAGWYTAQIDGDLLDDYTKCAGEATYYAHWTPVKYTLTLDPGIGGGFGSYEGWQKLLGGKLSKSFTYGDPIDEILPTPIPSPGFAFDGWDKTVPSTLTGNITLTAKWTQLYPIGITADPEEGGNPKLQVQGESETKETVWAPAGTVLTIVPNTKAGYRYDGWKVAEEQEVSPLSRNSSLNTGTYTVGTKGEQIVANYTKLITVTFDANGGEFAAGEGVSADKHQLVRTIDAGEKVTEPHPAPTKAGYVLDGWTIKSGDTQAQRPFSFDEPLDESVTITAKWKKLYTITVQADPAEGGTLTLYKNYDSGSETLSNPYSSNTVQVPEGTVLYLAYYANEPATGVCYEWDMYDYNSAEVDFGNYGSYIDDARRYITVCKITAKAADATIKVKFQKRFAVTFDANGGEFDSGKTTYTLWKDEDSKITSSDLPSDGMLRAGYTSAGWMTRTSTGFADFTVPEEGYTVTAPLDLYAKWSYQVTFDKGSAADAKGTMAPQTFYADTPAALNKCAFTSEDYAFAGWKVQGDTTDTVYKDKATFSSAKGDVTLVAQWTPKVTVTMDANGGHFGTSESDTTSQVKVAPGSTVSTAEPTMPRRENFDLHGWKTEDGKDFNLDSDAVNSDITLKAVWSYTVIFNRGEGDTKGPQMNNLLIVGDGEEKLPKCTYTKEGYVFAGWKVKNDTTDTVYADEANFSSAKGHVTLVAQWKKLCTIKVSVNSDSYGSAAIYLADDTGYTTPYTEVKVTEGTKLTLKVTPNTGYTFACWAYKDGTNSFGHGAEIYDSYVVQSDASIVAFLTPHGYRLTLDANGGVFRGAENATTTSTDVYHGDQVDQNYLKGLDAYLEGYDLSGWATEDGKPFDVEKTTITGDLTLVAQWTLKKYTVTFHANGGLLNDGNGTKEVQVDWGKTIQTADVPTATREGYTADEGWFTADEGGTVFDMTTTIKENTTLYAHWTLKDYTITVTTDGGGTASASKSTAHVGDVITLSATANPGKQFRGWNVKTGKVWIVEGNTFTMGAADVEIEALFDDLVTVTFDANGGTLAAGSEPQTFVKYGTATMPDDPSKEDYTFAGWYELDADHPFDFSTAVNSDLTLYAQWTKNGTPTPEPTATVTPEETATTEPTTTPTPEETATTEPTATPTLEPTATLKPIVIVKQPTAPKGQEGQKVTITVEAEGEELNYQWFVNRNDGKGFVPCEGSNSSTHTTTVLKPEHNGYQYYCQITSKNDSQRTDTVTLVVDKLDLPQTGDSAQLTLWLTLVAASYGGMLYILHKGKKSKAE